MSKYILTNLLAVLCSFVSLQGQHEMQFLNAFQKLSTYTSLNNKNQLLFLSRNSLEKKVEGNAFWNDWEPAFIISQKNEVFFVTARYRIIDDEVQIKENEKIKALYPNLVQGIVFEKKALAVATIEAEDGGLCYGFYQLLSEGEVSLLKKVTLEQKTGNDDVVKIGKTVTKLYVKKGNEPAKVLPNNLDSLLRLMSKYQQLVKPFIEEEHLSLSEETDLIKIFDFYNHLN